MTDGDARIEQLERRVAQLESLVRQLAARAVAAQPAPPAPLVERPEPAVAITPAMLAEPPARRFVVRPMPQAPATDWEQWVGRRGLLAVGVLALIATTGFFLKYAIDRGWISPWVRVNGGVLLGALIALYGDRLIARGMRLYGGAIIGAGGALAYLAIWAAAAPYDLISPRLGVLLLLGVTLGVAARAVRYRTEALCAWALIGAMCAPFFVRPPSSDINLLLAYIAAVAGGCGAIAARLGWRTTFALAVAGYFLMPLLAPFEQRTVPVMAFYLTGGVLAVLLATERRPMPESRVGALVAGWAFLLGLAATPEMAPSRWLTLGCALALTVAVWRFHVRENPFARGPDDWYAEPFVYFWTPVAMMWLAWRAEPDALRDSGAVPALLALLYLASGWQRRARHLVGMGFAFVALAIAGQWDYEAVAIGWSALAVVAIAADRWNGQAIGRPAAAVLATFAFIQLFIVAFIVQAFDGRSNINDPTDPWSILTHPWSLAWYFCTAAWALAAYLWPVTTVASWWQRRGRAWIWAVAGLSLWLGGSLELAGLFTNRLARDLAISAFWLGYAGALVALGFRLEQKAVRIAGLMLAGVAALKIVLYDLSQLEALYRVGSFFALAIIALAVAYSYNRRKLDSQQ